MRDEHDQRRLRPAAGAAGLGFYNIAISRGDRTHLALQAVRYGLDYYPSIGLVAAARFLGLKHEELVLDLNRARPINLAVVDAIKTTLGSEGPWNGDLKPAAFNRLIISKDPVAADAISTKTIGFDPMADDNTPTWKDTDNYLRIAEESGMGIHDTNKIEVV